MKAFVNKNDAEDYYLKLRNKLGEKLIKVLLTSNPKIRLLGIPIDEDNTNFNKVLLYNCVYAGSGSWVTNVEYEDLPL